MTKSRKDSAGHLGLAGVLLVLSGILHCLNWLVAGWNPDSLKLVVFGLLYLLLGVLLRAGVSWARYIAILSVTGGGTGAAVMLRIFAVPEWLTGILIVLDIAIFLLLLAGIWRGRTRDSG